ncbi:hypothetical protein PEPIB1_48 (plasmid) [Tritonibacter mobilis]|nr:hypothetical protein PEPIB1_48 [Tritonibacter mobilis]
MISSRFSRDFLQSRAPLPDANGPPGRPDDFEHNAKSASSKM